MAITRIEAQDFKSFSSLDMTLGAFNVVVGANAAGKSNLVQLLAFLHDIADRDLENAVSLQAGIEYLRNINNSTSRPLRISVSSDEHAHIVMERPDSSDSAMLGLKIVNETYDFALRTRKRDSTYTVVDDRLTQEFELWSLRMDSPGKIEEVEKLDIGTIRIARDGEFYKVTIPRSAPRMILESAPYSYTEGQRALKNDVLLGHPIRPLLRSRLFETIADLAIYDLDPKAPKRGVALGGPADLAPDASNLAIILRELLASPEESERLSLLLRDLLPFISQIDVQRFVDRSLLLRLRETYAKGKYIPASLLSDGTIHVTALLVALYFQDAPLAVIEEPERNLHPHLIARLLSMMKDVSAHRQILLTTHSSEVVRHCDPEDLFLVSRDRSGHSVVSKPIDAHEVRVFLENEMGLADLFASNLLAR